MRTPALLIVALLLAACSWGGSEHQRPVARTTPVESSSLAAHTPSDLRHPCHAVTARAASEIIGAEVVAHRERSRGRTLRCRFVVTAGAVAVSGVEIRSAPDLTSLAHLVGLYLGTDRLPHHPVDLVGADGAEVVVQPARGLVTLFAKQGFVTHAVVVRASDPEVGEAVAADLAALVLRANR